MPRLLERIFIDLDGVLNQFAAYVLKMFGANVDPSDFEYSWWDARWGSELYHAACDLIEEPFANGETSFWKSIPEEVWSDCPPSQELHWLPAYCESLVGKDNVAILTTPSSNPNSLSGKLKWVEKFIPSMKRRLLIGKPKHLCVHGASLLIDDRNEVTATCTKGHTLLVPQPWNTNACLVPNRADYIREQLLSYLK